MNATRQTAVLGFLVGVLLLTALFAPVVSAQPEQSAADEPDDDKPGDEYTYRIVQGDQDFEVRPIQGAVPAEEFYDYRDPYQSRENPSWGRSFSSRGTADYQQDSTSILMLYEGPDGVSLIAVHDKYHEDLDDATAGSSVSFQLTGLPDDGEWAMIDDDYGWRIDGEEKGDVAQLGADHRAGAAGNDGEPPAGVDARLSWAWKTGRTDGMAYRGLASEDLSLTIDPAFNEDSYHRVGDDRRPDEEPDDPEEGEEYNGTIDDWQVISATEDGEEFKRIWFDSLDEEVTIETVPDAEPVAASLSGPEQVAVGHNATFTANGTADIDGYEWTVDGTPVESADGPALTRSFQEPGTAEVNVTVSTADGRSDTASSTAEIVESQTDRTNETDEADETDETESTDDGTPGFGAGAALVGLAAAILLAARRVST